MRDIRNRTLEGYTEGDTEDLFMEMAEPIRSHFLQGNDQKEDQTMRELNFLAKRIERMTEQEQEILGAAIQIEKPFTLAAVVNVSCNLDKYTKRHTQNKFFQ